MKKYKVIKPFFKLSEKKNYEIGDEIELNQEGFISLNEYVVSPKTIDEVDKEIKKANKKLK